MNDIKCREYDDFISILDSILFLLTRSKCCHENTACLFCIVFCPFFRIHFESPCMWWKIWDKMDHSFLFSDILVALFFEKGICIFDTFSKAHFRRPPQFSFCFFWITNRRSEIDISPRDDFDWDCFFDDLFGRRDELTHRCPLPRTEIPYIPGSF